MDREVRAVRERCDDMALQLLTRERQRVERLSEALLQAETLDSEQAYDAAGVPFPPRPVLAAPVGPTPRLEKDRPQAGVGSQRIS